MWDLAFLFNPSPSLRSCCVRRKRTSLVVRRESKSRLRLWQALVYLPGEGPVSKRIWESIPWLTSNDTRGLLCSSHLWNERTNKDSPRGYSENQIRSNILGLSPSHLLFTNHNRPRQFPDHDQLFLASASLFVFFFLIFFSFVSFIMIYLTYNGLPRWN